MNQVKREAKKYLSFEICGLNGCTIFRYLAKDKGGQPIMDHPLLWTVPPKKVWSL